MDALDSVLIPPSHAYSCIALQSASVAPDLPLSLNLGEGLWVFTRPPFEMDAQWIEWLGTLQAKTFSRSNLLLFAVGPATEEALLTEKVDFLFWGTLLCSVWRYEHGLTVRGSRGDGHVAVSSVGDLTMHSRHWEARVTFIDEQALRSAAEVVKGLSEVFAPVRAYTFGRKEPERYFRVRRGFYALLKGFRETYFDSRLHQCVRAVDALLATESGHGREHFVDRGQALLARPEKDVLGELYQLRSRIEHMRDWTDIVTKHGDATKTAMKRCLQAEILAVQAYLCLLTTPAARQHFETESAVREYWRNRRESSPLGTPIDLSALVDQSYFPCIVY